MQVTVYGATWCQPCRNTKKFLTAKNIDFTFIDVDEEGVNEELAKLLGKPIDTVPKIFIDGTLIGGLPELQTYLEKHYEPRE